MQQQRRPPPRCSLPSLCTAAGAILRLTFVFQYSPPTNTLSSTATSKATGQDSDKGRGGVATSGPPSLRKGWVNGWGVGSQLPPPHLPLTSIMFETASSGGGSHVQERDEEEIGHRHHRHHQDHRSGGKQATPQQHSNYRHRRHDKGPSTTHDRHRHKRQAAAAAAVNPSYPPPHPLNQANTTHAAAAKTMASSAANKIMVPIESNGVPVLDSCSDAISVSSLLSMSLPRSSPHIHARGGTIRGPDYFSDESKDDGDDDDDDASVTTAGFFSVSTGGGGEDGASVVSSSKSTTPLMANHNSEHNHNHHHTNKLRLLTKGNLRLAQAATMCGLNVPEQQQQQQQPGRELTLLALPYGDNSNDNNNDDDNDDELFSPLNDKHLWDFGGRHNNSSSSNSSSRI